MRSLAARQKLDFAFICSEILTLPPLIAPYNLGSPTCVSASTSVVSKGSRIDDVIARASFLEDFLNSEPCTARTCTWAASRSNPSNSASDLPEIPCKSPHVPAYESGVTASPLAFVNNVKLKAPRTGDKFRDAHSRVYFSKIFSQAQSSLA
jgi:hypothetical protein